jgi:hypothetical protein
VVRLPRTESGQFNLPHCIVANLTRFMLQTPSTMAVIGMMVAEAGSESQRNAERKGFRIAYTRMKWRLSSQRQAI